MHRRKWVLIVAILGAVIIFGGYFGWRLTRANDRIKNILLEKAQPFLAQDSDIEHVETDLSSLHLSGVRLAPKDRSFSVEIQDVRLGYSLWNLIKYGFSPHKVTHEVILIHPVVVVYKSSLGKEGKSAEKEWLGFKKMLEELNAIKRITVREAEVILEDSSGKKLRMTHSLDGCFRALSADSASVRLTGKLLESRDNNLAMEGSLSLLSGKPLRMFVNIKESVPSSELPFLLPSYIKVTGGRIQGKINFDHVNGASGFLEIRNGGLSFKKANLKFEDVNVKGIFKGKDFELRKAVAKFNGSRLKIQGKVHNILDPHLDISIICNRFDVSTFLSQAVPESRYPVSGTGRFNFYYTGFLNNPIMKGNFSSKNLTVSGISFDNFRAKISLCDNIFSIDGLGRENGKTRLNLKGSIDFSNSLQKTSLALGLNGNFSPLLPSWVRKKVVSCSGNMEVRAGGELSNLIGKAIGNLTVVSQERDTLFLQPDFSYTNKILSVNIQSNKEFALSGEIRSPFLKNSVWEIKGKGIENVIQPMLSDRLRRMFVGMSIEGDFSSYGTKREIWFRGLNNNKKTSPRVFEVKITDYQTKKARDRIKFVGSYFGSGGEELPILAYGTLSKQNILINRGVIGDFASIWGHYQLDSTKKLQLYFKLSNFSIDKVHNIFPALRAYSGKLWGNIKINGTALQPAVNLDLTLQKGNFHTVGIFEGEFNARWKGRKLQMLKISFQRNGDPILTGKVENIKGDSLSGELEGERVKFGDLILALAGENIFKGTGNINIQFGGKADAPVLSGAVEVNDGTLKSIPFRKLKTEMVDTLWTEQGFAGGMFYIKNGQLIRNDGLKLLFWGDIPHTEEKDADISLLAQGNILSILPEISDMVKKANGEGEIFLRWGGRPGEWVLGRGRAAIDNGEIELSSFVKKIKKLNARIELKEKERFVHVSNLSGEIDGGMFRITNIPEGSKGVVPLILDKPGLNLGIIKLSSAKKGIKLHLPGLMEKGDQGRLAFGGIKKEGSFIIAGPSSEPLFRGTLFLRSLRLTYPFLSIKSDAGVDKTLAFLQKINWDIRVVPEKDVCYIRDIETPLGNINVALQLQNEYGELYLKGIIQQGNFEVWGNLVSTEGSIDVLDHYFKPERITFDYPRGADDPIIAGRAFTTVTDSMGMMSTIWLSLSSIDDVTGMKTNGGPWGKVKFRFSTDNPNLGRTEADLLSAMGYSEKDLKDRAYDALGMRIENLVFRPIFRPIEREIRRHLGLDIFRLSSMFGRNVVQLRAMNRSIFDPKFLFRSTKLTLGKYLARGLFLTYSGQVDNGFGFRYPSHGIGFRHALTLEYAIRPDLFLQMEYTYDSQLLSDRREDKRIWLRHTFPF